MKEPHLILGIGELLWDMLPEGPRLGGAPANFSVMAGRLGNHSAILSRIGRDDLGREAVHRLDPLPADTTSTVWPDGDPVVAGLAWRMRLLDRSHLLASLATVGCPVVPWSGPRTLEEVLRRLARRTQVPRVGGSA